MIIVRFKAPRKAADDIWPGRVSLTDEATGTVYNEVPAMPMVGPLIGRPSSRARSGYVMFINIPPGLPADTLVTVQLDIYSGACPGSRTIIRSTYGVN